MPDEIQPQGLLATLLRDFQKAGGKIDYVLIGGLFLDGFNDVYAFHKAAAGFTLEAVVSRYPRSRDKGPTSRREPEKAVGVKIEPASFFAPGYRGIPLDLIQHLTPEELEIERLKLDQEIFSHGEIGQDMHNYHYAFAYPPYGIDSHLQERLFPAINHALFGDDLEALTIYEWSTDWAEYFNDGNIWWGSFLWTVYSTQTQLLVGIAASTSD